MSQVKRFRLITHRLTTTAVVKLTGQWRSQPKNFGGAKIVDFRRIALFCLEKRLSKLKMTIFSENFGGHGPPGYAFVTGINLLRCFSQRILSPYCRNERPGNPVLISSQELFKFFFILFRSTTNEDRPTPESVISTYHYSLQTRSEIKHFQ